MNCPHCGAPPHFGCMCCWAHMHNGGGCPGGKFGPGTPAVPTVPTPATDLPVKGEVQGEYFVGDDWSGANAWLSVTGKIGLAVWDEDRNPECTAIPADEAEGLARFILRQLGRE